jgi:RNA polymerase sigma-70 factor (sigma-E family)
MDSRDAEVSFEDFVRARSNSLLRTALLLVGQHRAEAEDLVQFALERAYRYWPRVSGSGDPERYVRRILANASVDRWRRIARRAELPMPMVVPDAATQDRTAEIAERDYLLRALATLPPGQRAVLVLRYFDDLSEGETAEMLGCSVGTVKSQAFRALTKLRGTVEPTATGRLGKARAARRKLNDVAEVGVDV